MTESSGGAGAVGPEGANDDESGWRYTSNPQTIWALPEELRLTAVTEMFRRLSVDFIEARRQDKPKAAQEAAAGAIMTVAGLFADGDDPAHHLIHSLVGAIVSARSGSTDHILLKKGTRVPGTRGGYGQAVIAGFAVAAVDILQSWDVSKSAARKTVAKILSDRGLSLRKGEHGAPKAVTGSAIRRWQEEADANPIPTAVAPKMRKSIEGDIVANSLTSLDQVVGLLADHADALMPHALAY